MSSCYNKFKHTLNVSICFIGCTSLKYVDLKKVKYGKPKSKDIVEPKRIFSDKLKKKIVCRQTVLRYKRYLYQNGLQRLQEFIDKAEAIREDHPEQI